MMTKRFSALILIILLCGAGLLFPLFCESGKWVIGAQKFSIDNVSSEDTVNSKTAELIPSDILEKLGYSVVRNVMPDEQFERTKYKLRTERQSLFLQLSAEYKKRDSLVLSNYSDFKLKSAIHDSEKKIKDIQKKIDENLAELKKAEDKNEKQMEAVSKELLKENKEASELEKFQQLFKNIFVRDENLILQEQISFYKDDIASLYVPPAESKELDFTEALYAKNVYTAGINSLITGHYSKYGDYLSVYVDLYSYPEAKKIGSVAEVGSVQELELISNGIAMQLVPLITNSLPVQLEITMYPEEAAAGAVIYLDDDLQKTEAGKIIIGSGIHTIQFISEGFKTVSTTYSFEGNRSYKVDVNFEKPKSGFLQVGLRNTITGEILMNGERALEIDGKKSQIAINGKEILGEFVAENGETAFFYIPKKLVYDGSFVTIKPKPRDRMAYIDKRRKIMYASYSVFMISLIPSFYTYGNYKNYLNLYKNSQTDYQTAKDWETATNVTRFISVGCGIFWGYELVRYLIAANSVLPQNARPGDPLDFEYNDIKTVEQSENNEELTNEEPENNGDIE